MSNGSVEYSNGSRSMGTFPAHWKGIYPGQSSEERSAVIIQNMAADAAAKGNTEEARDIISSYRNAGPARSAKAALERVRRLSGR